MFLDLDGFLAKFLDLDKITISGLLFPSLINLLLTLSIVLRNWLLDKSNRVIDINMIRTKIL